METLSYISRRKKELLRMLGIDHEIRADPYENVARLKEIEKIENVLIKELAKKGADYEVLS